MKSLKIIDLSLKINGFPLEKAKDALRQIQAIDTETFEAYIEEKKRNILSYHLQHNALYQTIDHKRVFFSVFVCFDH